MDRKNEGNAGCSIFGEHAIFKEPWIMPVRTEEMSEESRANLDVEAYLRKGEKILSLLRKKEPRKFRPDIMLEKVKKEWKKTKAEAEKHLAKELEKKFLELMEESDLDNACGYLRENLFSQLNMEEEKDSRPLKLLQYLCPTAPRMIVRVCNWKEPLHVPIGSEFKKRHEPACKFRNDPGPYMAIANLDSLLGELALRRYLLDKLRYLKSGKSLFREYEQIPAIGKMQTKLRGVLENLEISDLMAKEFYTAILVFYPESKEAEQAALLNSGIDMNILLLSLQEDYIKRKEEARMEKELSNDYAKSFQTKKNIPQKYVHAMRTSAFNKHFGYVEFDADCDLKLMEELSREYGAFAKELGLPKYGEVSLRFRKLGCHRASGLYYYTLKCLCVDVRAPGSFAHEVGHMIDYHEDHISAKYVFHEIYERYESLLKAYMSKASGREKEVLCGRTKYNLKYYLQPTEVFARCFEMYLLRILKINNSLLEESGGFEYPKDETLDGLLKDFFDPLLKNLKEGKKEAA